MKRQTHTIDGEAYLEIETVSFKGKEYKKLVKTGMRPGTKFAEIINGDFLPVEDKDIYYSLRLITSDVLSLHGVLILDGPSLYLNEDDFVLEKGELVILNDNKRSVFEKYTKEKSNL